MSDANQFLDPERISPTDETISNRCSLSSGTVLKTPASPPGPQAFRRRETISPGASVLLIVLAIVLIGGGLGFIIYAATTQYQATLHSEATATANLTAQARVATQIHNEATANAFAIANANI